MQSAKIAIIGAGLSGLYAATMLKQSGIDDYVIVEARPVLGGRILSTLASGQSGPELEDHASGHVDLGPTWFWPAFQPELDRLVAGLGIARFDQYETGDMLSERSAGAAPMRLRGYASSPASMRLAGGMGALIHALRQRLEPSRILTGRTVRQLRIEGENVALDCADEAGLATTMEAEHVLLALPPRLAEATIAFAPPLPERLAQQWQETPTWMASHAKYVAVYNRPFWREEGLSGAARSAVGPMGEIHDASMPGGRAALFGFFGVPPIARRTVSEDVLRLACRAQFARLFGPQAEKPVADFIKDWATDSLTATAMDLESGQNHHAVAPAATASSGPWQGRLTGIASEWSRNFPGYVAGAVDAAVSGTEHLLRLNRSFPKSLGL
ncbi:flavin monoamine oxidase family protein [Cupriavidus consociatus]|uniref:flavin monoamine oxidase family protein n=1 Tax=Cupriavidus consociatus TaxID=2821357 RepID=UPI001AE273F4|nr:MULTISPECIES: FAD-dependent oxidoreductase [unclassified Cupriavidus]MBP0623677.1 FAD-dependent oxidoreductase [Cupriavidus sp. LEh25]MDK2660381.1 FAD-dependent oxidoreductase [Cupriavidus sp. LEh21]